ncbi:MAG: hypothetical protein Ct9H300mP11_06090 [Chloroflexota bacterium]|nr:MAG: hypothetical protein Ct9H300mP11_06090 [Chloroflexota bacterium]
MGFTIEGYGLGCNTAGPKHGLFVIFNLYRIPEIGPVNMSYTYVLRSTDVDRGAVCGLETVMSLVQPAPLGLA